jgi:hypothetical protein
VLFARIETHEKEQSVNIEAELLADSRLEIGATKTLKSNRLEIGSTIRYSLLAIR